MKYIINGFELAIAVEILLASQFVALFATICDVRLTLKILTLEYK